MTEFWVLNGHTPVASNSITEWSRFLERPDRIVAQTFLGEILISTKFLGLNLDKTDPPTLFETVVFQGTKELTPLGIYRNRYATWEEAEQGHGIAVELMQERIRSKLL